MLTTNNLNINKSDSLSHFIVRLRHFSCIIFSLDIRDVPCVLRLCILPLLAFSLLTYTRSIFVLDYAFYHFHHYLSWHTRRSMCSCVRHSATSIIFSLEIEIFYICSRVMHSTSSIIFLQWHTDVLYVFSGDSFCLFHHYLSWHRDVLYLFLVMNSAFCIIFSFDIEMFYMCSWVMHSVFSKFSFYSYATLMSCSFFSPQVWSKYLCSFSHSFFFFTFQSA